MGFDLFFKLCLGNVPRAKVRSNHPVRSRRTVDLGRDRSAGAELVCAIARYTTEDSAGTSPSSRHGAAYWTHQCDAVGRSEAERDYDSANFRARCGKCSGGKKLCLASPTLVSVFAASGN